MTAPCVFCDIVARTGPAHLLDDGPLTCAFMDIKPVTPGHLLVIPKRHAELLADLTEDEDQAAFAAGRRLAAALRASGLRCDGVNYFVADGEAAGQEIAQFHLHVIPRFQDDSFRVDADYSDTPTFDALADPAGRIRTAMTERAT